MAKMTSDEMAKGVLAAHAAIHTLTLSLVEREAISAEKALKALNFIAMASDKNRQRIAENIQQLERLAALESKTS